VTGVPSPQAWSAERYTRNAGFVSELGSPVVELLDPRPGERILDLGCGDGALTRKLAEAGALVIGVDTAPDMVAAARRRGLDARVLPAESLAFDREFDAVFSNAALHWMRPLDRVIAGVGRALKPGGRFVGELGGHGNVAAIVTALIAVLARRGIDGAARSPWQYPTADEYRELLEAAGFVVDWVVLVPRPTPLPTGLEGWLQTFTDSFFQPLAPADRTVAMREVVDLLRPSLCDRRGQWTADYVRLRFAARRADGGAHPDGVRPDHP
jgi:SAM-dependent methyltransferase